MVWVKSYLAKMNSAKNTGFPALLCGRRCLNLGTWAIVSRRGAGSFVTRGSLEHSAFSPLNSIDDIACYFHFRRTIEGTCAEMAARRASQSDVKRLRELVNEVQRRLDIDGDQLRQIFNSTCVWLSYQTTGFYWILSTC